MKKISAVLLVLVLVGSVAFAGFTGSASVGVGYDLDSTDYGFLSQGTGVSVDVTFEELLGEAKGDGDIYASIKATLDFTFSNADDDSVADADMMLVGANLDFDHAKIFGEDWYVSILGAMAAPDFAKSAIDSTDRPDTTNDLSYTLKQSAVAASLSFGKAAGKAPKGVEVGFKDFAVGLGFVGNADAETYDLHAAVVTPAFEFADGLTGKAGAALRLKQGNNLIIGGSVEVAYADDDLAVKVASDVLLDNKDFDADVAVAASYTDYSLDVYFATKTNDGENAVVDNRLSAKVTAAIDPVTITFTGKDLINTQDLGLEVAFQATEELAVSVNGGYNIGTEVWKAGADVEYETDAFVATLGGSYDSNEILGVSASIASETVVPGATLKLAYVGADDLMKKGDAYDPLTGDNTQLGKVVASVAIAF